MHNRFLALFVFAMSISSFDTYCMYHNYFDVQSQRKALGAVTLGLITIPTYLYIQKKLQERSKSNQITRLVNDHEQRIKQFNDTIEKQYGGDKQNFSSDQKEFEKLVNEFSPSKTTLLKWIQDEREIYDWPSRYTQKSSDFYVKDEKVERVVNAAIIGNYIKEKKYKFVDVPKKYLFFAGDSWHVIAEKIPLLDDKDYKITIEQIKEVSDIVETMDYKDFFGINLIFGKNKKVFFIDTEDNAFDIGDCSNKYRNIQALKHYFRSRLSSSATEWLENRIKELAPQKDSTEQCGNVFSIKKLGSINLELVENYLNKIKAVIGKRPFGYNYYASLKKNDSSAGFIEKIKIFFSNLKFW